MALSATLTLAMSSGSPLSPIITSAGDNYFRDATGRVRIFHGGNRVAKGFPWYFPSMLNTDKEASLMEDLGFTVVRLGFMWSGYNPAPVLSSPGCVCIWIFVVVQLWMTSFPSRSLDRVQ